MTVRAASMSNFENDPRPQVGDLDRNLRGLASAVILAAMKDCSAGSAEAFFFLESEALEGGWRDLLDLDAVHIFDWLCSGMKKPPQRERLHSRADRRYQEDV